MMPHDESMKPIREHAQLVCVACELLPTLDDVLGWVEKSRYGEWGCAICASRWFARRHAAAQADLYG
jgi:hypothetical protein